jgi:hypothetical protein
VHVNDFIASYCPNNLLEINEHIKKQISAHKKLSRNSHMNVILLVCFKVMEVCGGWEIIYFVV